MKDSGSLFVGGEFYYDDRWKSDLPTIPTGGTTFLNGGKACLTIISDYLLDHGITRVLLPAYLCPTIVDTFESRGLSCDYYAINADFSINTQDLDRHLTEKQAVYFINYFGFSPSPSVLAYFEQLRRQKIVVIEDNAQSGFMTHTTGDFAFNSLRKLCPYDGGYLKTAHDVQPYLKAYQGRENRRLPIIRQYRSKLRDYLFCDLGDHAELEAMFDLAEHYYASDSVVLGDEKEQQQIELLNWPAIKQIRRNNYTQLLQLISGISTITPIIPSLQPDNMPLGLPVYVSENSRDQLNDYLGENGIGLTIHWEDLVTDSRLNNNPLAVEMAGNILTLTIDQYTSQKQLKFLARKLTDFHASSNQENDLHKEASGFNS
jgi:dTDP-4-amino-4,6-dideoxygalactose transaminase